MKYLYKTLRYLIITLIILAVSGTQATVSALTAEQLRIYNLGIKTYVQEEIDCSTTATPTIPGGGTAVGAKPKNIYMLGDSITNGAVSKYKTAFEGARITSYINAAGGRSWAGGGIAGAVTPEGSLKPGKDAIVDDKAKIAAADGIVIALGTNGGESMNPIGDMINAFRADGFAPDTPIWWVNTVSITGLPALGGFNKKLDEEATRLSFKVVNWSKAVNSAADPYVMPITDAAGYMGDYVHPNGKGQDALVALVVAALGEGGTAAAKTAGGTCECGVANDPGSPTLRGGTNPEIMFNYFVDKGLTAEQAAGVTGNAMAESGENIDPAIVSPLNYHGIFQWDHVNRWPRLVAWAKEKGKDHLLLETQMEFSWEEAEGRGNIDGLKEQTDVEHATWYWGRFFEVAIIGGSTSEVPLTNVQVLDKRTKYANQVFDSFGGSVTNGGSSNTASAKPSVIALDPGHGAAIPEYTDSVTGLKASESPNSPEREDAQDVAGRIKAQLEQEGYSVVLLKDSADGKVTFRERVDKAKAAGASLAISIHTTPGDINEVWPQRVGKFRENVSDQKRVTFDNKETADLSDKYAKAIAEERTATEGHPVDTDPDQSTQQGAFGKERGLPAWGDMSLVQLWSTDVPWVYNEIGHDTGTAISEARKQAYADGIVNGVKKAVPKTVEGVGVCSGVNLGNRDLAATVKAYAWPDPRNTGEAGALEMMTAYKEAVDKAKSESRYIGGISHPGVDCGGFVTLALIDSGYEPNYNYGGKWADGAGNTVAQLRWVRENWQKLGRGNEITTAQLKLGDVAFKVTSSGDNDNHTFMYTGEITGFNGTVASAGLDGRAPSANGGFDHNNVTQSNYEWYRKK